MSNQNSFANITQFNEKRQRGYGSQSKRIEQQQKQQSMAEFYEKEKRIDQKIGKFHLINKNTIQQIINNNILIRKINEKRTEVDSYYYPKMKSVININQNQNKTDLQSHSQQRNIPSPGSQQIYSVINSQKNTNYSQNSYKINEKQNFNNQYNQEQLYQIHETKNENLNSDDQNSVDVIDYNQKMIQMKEIEFIMNKNDKKNKANKETKSFKLPSINSSKHSLDISQPEQKFIQRKLEKKEKRIQQEIQLIDEQNFKKIKSPIYTNNIQGVQKQSTKKPDTSQQFFSNNDIQQDNKQMNGQKKEDEVNQSIERLDFLIYQHKRNIKNIENNSVVKEEKKPVYTEQQLQKQEEQRKKFDRIDYYLKRQSKVIDYKSKSQKKVPKNYQVYDQKYHQNKEQQKIKKVFDYRNKRGAKQNTNYTQMKIPYQNVKTIQNTIIDTSINSINNQQFELQQQLEQQNQHLEQQKQQLENMQNNQSFKSVIYNSNHHLQENENYRNDYYINQHEYNNDQQYQNDNSQQINFNNDFRKINNVQESHQSELSNIDDRPIKYINKHQLSYLLRDE